MGFVSLASSQSQYFSVLVVFFIFFSPWEDHKNSLEHFVQLEIINYQQLWSAQISCLPQELLRLLLVFPPLQPDQYFQLAIIISFHIDNIKNEKKKKKEKKKVALMDHICVHELVVSKNTHLITLLVSHGQLKLTAPTSVVCLFQIAHNQTWEIASSLISIFPIETIHRLKKYISIMGIMGMDTNVLTSMVLDFSCHV